MKSTEYHSREMFNLADKISHLALAPLPERKEAMSDAAELMRDLPRLTRNIEWCIAGSYGYAEQVTMCRIRDIKRGNRPAQAMQLMAALDCFCPQRECIAAWKSLTASEQSALDTAIRGTLDLCMLED